MMKVNIHNGNAIEMIGVASIGRGDCDIVEQAEAHRLVRLRVMSRRANEGESSPQISRTDFLDAFQDPSCGKKPDAIALG